MNALAKPIALSHISREVGLVFFASLFVGPISANAWNATLIFSGLILSLIFWITSLLLAKE